MQYIVQGTGTLKHNGQVIEPNGLVQMSEEEAAVLIADGVLKEAETKADPVNPPINPEPNGFPQSPVNPPQQPPESPVNPPVQPPVVPQAPDAQMQDQIRHDALNIS